MTMRIGVYGSVEGVVVFFGRDRGRSSRVASCARTQRKTKDPLQRNTEKGGGKGGDAHPRNKLSLKGRETTEVSFFRRSGGSGNSRFSVSVFFFGELFAAGKKKREEEPNQIDGT
jgi:hypothetical protein